MSQIDIKMEVDLSYCEELKIKLRENQQEGKKVFDAKTLKSDIFNWNISFFCLKCINKSDRKEIKLK